MRSSQKAKPPRYQSSHSTAYMLMIVAVVYWFCFFLAPFSPLYLFLQSLLKLAFGYAGTHIAFALMGMTGFMMWRQHLSSHRRVMKGLILMICISAILNFPFVDHHQTAELTRLGGYASWPFIQILNILLGTNPFAIKLSIMMVSVVVCLILWQTSPYHTSFNWSNLIRIRPALQKTSAQKISRKSQQENPQIQGPSKEGSWWSRLGFGPKSASSTLSHHPLEQASQILPKPQPKTVHLQQTGSLIDIPKLASHIMSKVQQKQVSSKAEPKDSVGSKSFAITQHNKVSLAAISIPTFPLALLEAPQKQTAGYSTEQIQAKAQLIQDKLREFDIMIDFVSCDIGPSIIQLRFQPQAGVKLSKIEAYKDDIQYVLRVKTLRIVAPIPGTDAIGIQIPNPNPRMVRLSEVLGSEFFIEESPQSQTYLSIGVDIENNMMIKTLESMPHLLVAGATGSGKSVGVNDFILSLIYQNTPHDLRFVMIDPKQVELEMYDGLPYLLAPVITTPDRALKALKWSVDEMEARYTKLKNAKLKHISEYNSHHAQDPMSRIVIIIDELADLMLSGNKKEIETYIVRIAQKARAVGMHLITATQRPSVNVITGLIKANIPTRIAFGVAQLVDSRTILDQKGAENLVGKGDLLYLDPSIRHPLRIQAPFVSTAEISRVVGHLKSKIIKKHMTESDFYHPELISILETKGGISSSTNNHSTEDDDESLVQQAIHIITTEKKASTTLLQRKLSIGFARAGRLMDILESRGIVGPQDGAKPRSILI